MKNIFKPIFNIIICIVSYSLLGALFYLELNKEMFFAAGINISGILLFIYISRLKKHSETTKKQHLIFLISTLLILTAMLAYHALTVKRSQYFFMFLGLASLPPFYNFCGFARFSKVNEKTSILKYILGITLVPFAAFLLYNYYTGVNYKTIYLIIIVAAYYFVLFSLIKIAVLVIKERNLIKKIFKTPKAKIFITLFSAIIMPITGLILNQHMFINSSLYASDHLYGIQNNVGIFGDFSHPMFYILTAINGILLLIPLSKCKKLKLPLFYMKSLLYCFVVYMLLVLLPTLPIGVMALFFIVGIYAFVPIFLTWYQGKTLKADYRFLKEAHKKKWIITIFILGFLTLPTILSAFFAYDKINFRKALVYAELNNMSVDLKVDVKSLERALNSQNFYSNINVFYGDRRFKTYYSHANIPLISGIYNLYMFGGKSLDYETKRTLLTLFSDHYYFNNIYSENPVKSENVNNNGVELSEATHETEYDETIQAYRTWIHLKLKNSIIFNAEYSTEFNLPDGAYISDYYLYVGNEKKPGLLTDKRAALTIYNRIVSSSRDPGILYYSDESTLSLRVFPFVPHEERKTGFEIIHLNNLDFNLDHHSIKIAVDTSLTKQELPNAILLNSEEIEKLPSLNKELDYNFILDCSKNSNTKKLIKRIKNYCHRYGISDGTVYLTSYRFEKHPLTDIDNLKFNRIGGFNLNLAVKDVFKNSDNQQTPIIIFVTDKNESGILLPKRLINYTSRESDFYYRLEPILKLTPYSFYTNYKSEAVNEPVIKNAVSYEGFSVVNDGTDKLVILNDAVQSLTSNQYIDAVLLTTENKINARNGVQNSASYIRKSFQSHVLTPSTAFIVVETKEQEAELLKLQERMINSNKSFDVKTMSEPTVFIILIALLIFVLIKRVYRAKR